MSQGSLFDRIDSEIDAPQVDPPVVHLARPATMRADSQCGRMLTLLRSRSRVSNADLAFVSLKYTSRLSDLRKLGYDIRCVAHDHASGLAYYALIEDRA